jgi:hypothetical protein
MALGITRQAVAATSIDPTTGLPPTFTQKTGIAPPPRGIYTATVNSYDAGARTANITSTDYGTYTVTNGSGVALSSGNKVTVMTLSLDSKPGPTDQIVSLVS